MTKYRLAEFHNANNDLNGRWYYEYYYLNPDTGKLQRFREYKGFSKFKTIASRLEAINQAVNEINNKLLVGWSPFEPEFVFMPSPEHKSTTINKVLLDILKIKKQYQRFDSYRTTKTHIDSFMTWLTIMNLSQVHPVRITKPEILAYFNYLMTTGVSNRTRNNYLIDVKACFNYMCDQMEIIPKNPCKGITKLPEQSEKNVAFTKKEAGDISEWVEKKDPYLGFFCRFIAYCFMRPIEIRHIQLRDIDLDTATILLPSRSTKQGVRQYKTITARMVDELRKLDLDQYPQTYYLFTRKKYPGPIPPSSRMFPKRFKKFKKEYGFTKEHTMYGLKHTFVCNLIENGAKDRDVMRQADIKDVRAFEVYARSINAIKKKDLSEFYTIHL